MKRLYFLSLLLVVMLVTAGCSMTLEEMGVPFIPTRTNTPLPPVPGTPTPTFPPKPEVTEGALQTELLENEATLLTDTELGYQAVFSPEWLVLVMDGSFQSQLNTALNDQVTEDIQQLVNDASGRPGIRIVAIDYTYHHALKSVASINLAYTPNPAIADTEMLDVIESSAEAVPTRTPNANVSYQTVQTNAQGLEYGKMILDHPGNDTVLPIKQVVAVFKISDGLLVLTGAVEEESYLALESVFQRVIDSIQTIN